MEEYTHMLLGGGVEGLIAIDTPLDHPLPVPAVAIAGHRPVEGVTNLVFDHRLAAELILDHLQSLGHNQIVFVRGQTFSADAEERWRYLMEVAREKGIPIKPELVIQLTGETHSPELGYPVMQQLLVRQARFTAVVAFNDISAIGIIRALQDLKMSVPGDVSIIGFDDIEAAAFTVPRLTTVRQPLAEMGKIAAQYVLNRLHRTDKFRPEVTVEPSFVVRESTQAILQKRAQRSQD